MTACKIMETRYSGSFRYIYPFLSVMALVLLLIILFPEVSTWIPNAVLR